MLDFLPRMGKRLFYLKEKPAEKAEAALSAGFVY